MKKILSGLIAAFLLSAGFVAVSGEVANAAPSARACVKSKYNPCPSSKPKVSAPKAAKRGKKVKGAASVVAQGNVKPKGTIIITIKGPGINKVIKRVSYSGGRVSFATPALKKKGVYKITVKFVGSNTRDSLTSSTIRVK